MSPSRKSKRNSSVVVVVCHDAGGAEIISSYVKKHHDSTSFYCYVAGPAVNIFKRKHVRHEILSGRYKIEALLGKHRRISYLLSGTSWSSTMERGFIKAAKKLRIKTVVHLDHWTTYRERFGYPRKNWKNNLPDEIWVGDKHALKLARQSYPSAVPIKYRPNAYYAEIKHQYASRRNVIPKSLVFMSEPVTGDINSYGDKSDPGFTEYTVLDNILSSLSARHGRSRLIIRYHPSDVKKKYDQLIRRYRVGVRVIKSDKESILDDLVRASTVIGIDSAALVLAVICKRKVMSYIPSRRYKCTLPFPQIQKIKSLTALKAALSGAV